MIEVFYNGNEPIIINNIEFNKNKIAKITEEQLEQLNKISFFKDRINKNFKVVNRNIKKEEKQLINEVKKEVKEEIKEEDKQEDKAEDKAEEVDLDKLTFQELKAVADNLELEYQNNIKKENLKNLIKNATTETNNS